MDPVAPAPVDPAVPAPSAPKRPASSIAAEGLGTLQTMHRAAPNADALNALALQRPRDQTPAPPQNVWRVLDNKAALHAGKADEASSAQPTGVQGEKVAVLHTVSTCPNQTDAGESKAVAVHVTRRSMSDIEGSQLVLSIEDIRSVSDQ